MMTINSSQRKKILQIYNTSLRTVRGDECVKHYLRGEKFATRLVENEKIAILAIGKAAESMAQGAYDVVKDNFLRGLVISKSGHLLNSVINSRFEYFESSHPVPDERSLIAAQKVIYFIDGLAENTHLIVLISGGASALVEQTKAGISLEDLQRVNRWLIASGLAINEINAIRQQLSGIKGGQLASFAGHLKVSNLLISDVLNDDPGVIGSGLFIKNTTKLKVRSLPGWIEHILQQSARSKQFQGKYPIFTDLVATNTQLLNKIALLCNFKNKTNSKNKIFKFYRTLSADVALEADRIALQLISGENGFYIWGGEPTVILPDNAGKGGRNQHLALLIANKIKDMANVVVLCIGTDGTDGNTDDAGALVDGETVLRGEAGGYFVEDCIHACNSAVFLHASGDVINTGPTGTNVMDVVIACKWE